MRYWPVPSVTTVRTFSIRTGLAASTLTPGSTPPDASLTVPAIDACAYANDGKATIAAIRIPQLANLRMKLPPGAMSRGWRTYTLGKGDCQRNWPDFLTISPALGTVRRNARCH